MFRFQNIFNDYTPQNIIDKNHAFENIKYNTVVTKKIDA